MNKTLHLHIGSYKTGSTSIQNFLFKNQANLLKQGFCYPGNEMRHHKLYFLAKVPPEEWPIYFKWYASNQALKGVEDYLLKLALDYKKDVANYVVSTEHFFIANDESIKKLIDYFKRVFDEIIVYVFVREPVGYYKSFQQEMIKARSYIVSPEIFHYDFKAVIKGWQNYCHVNVIEHLGDSVETFCELIQIDKRGMSETEDTNVSLSIEQMVFLERMQKINYSALENTYKPHLALIRNIKPEFTNKPKLKKQVESIVYKKHEADILWLKDGYNIDFTLNKYDVDKEGMVFEKQTLSVDEVYEVNKGDVAKYEYYLLNLLLKKIAR